MVRSHRGRQYQTLCRKRICPRDCSAARIGEIRRSLGHEDTDHYDTIEWITHQPWCDGNVGMVGISGYAGEQWRAAEQGHPALKAIFPYDACSAYGGMFGFRDFYPGRRLAHVSL